jgi:geranylgeranyl diphosphate synthase type II
MLIEPTEFTDPSSGPLTPPTLEGFHGRSTELLAGARERIELRLDALVPREALEPKHLHQAIRYSLLAPGKRIRPILTLLTAATFGGEESSALDPACAIEMVHTASLIFDDLPSMDDASLRRGKPANHRVFGEATSTLAAIALLNRAYGVIGESLHLSPRTRSALVALLSRAVGTEGVVAGQCRDLEEGSKCDVETLSQVEGLKTAALFVAAVESGAVVAGLADDELEPMRQFGWNLGLAFQLRDDWIDVVGTREEAGKDVRQDASKTTLASLLGIKRSRALFDELLDSATDAVEPLGPPGRAIARLCREFVTLRS